MRRREFIAGLGGAVTWPLAARAQQGDRVRPIGVLMGLDENDPVAKLRLSAFTQGLADLGWADGRSVRVDIRWAGTQAVAQELVGLQPDIILAHGAAVARVLRRETRTIPIVFVNVADPVGSGLIAALNHPGGNITGYALYETPLGAKWLELLLEIAPGLKRAAIMFNPDTAAVSAYVPSFETAAVAEGTVTRIARPRSTSRPPMTEPPEAQTYRKTGVLGTEAADHRARAGG